jgi:hypothetical protein
LRVDQGAAEKQVKGKREKVRISNEQLGGVRNDQLESRSAANGANKFAAQLRSAWEFCAISRGKAKLHFWILTRSVCETQHK